MVSKMLIILVSEIKFTKQEEKRLLTLLCNTNWMSKSPELSTHRLNKMSGNTVMKDSATSCARMPVKSSTRLSESSKSTSVSEPIKSHNSTTFLNIYSRSQAG